VSADACLWFEDGGWHASTDRCTDKCDHSTFDLLRAIRNAEQCIDHDLWWTPGSDHRLDGWGYYREKPNL